MIINEFYKIREDGVNLYINIDALTDENGNVVYENIVDEQTGEVWRKPVPRGFKILQNETGATYSEAIDVENAPYTYSETNEPIEATETDMTEMTEKAKAYDILMGVES